MYICEKCGKEVFDNYGSGRFCSRSCANTRIHSDETKNKIRESLKKDIEYVEYKGKLISKNRYTKIIDRHNQYIQRRSELAIKINLADSPYSDFDTAYDNSGTDKDCYYFVKHDENNKIIDRCIVPRYKYIIECEIGRKLGYNEIIHHIDGNHFNNSRDNLIIMSRSEHASLHNSIRHGTSMA